MEPMRILRVIASMDPSTGGPCQGIRNTVPAMRGAGCQTEVVCLDAPGSSFLGSDPFHVHALGKGTGPLYYHPALVPWLLSNLGRFDTVIVHGLWLWTSIAVRIATQRLRKKAKRPAIASTSLPSVSPGTQRPTLSPPPYFVMPHGMLDPWFQNAPERRWKALRNRLYWHLAEHRVISDAEGVLFTCCREMELASTTFHRYRPKQEIDVGYGLPPPPPAESIQESLNSRIPNLPSCHPFLLFLGRIHPKKGVDLLIRAYAEVYASRTDNSAPVPHLVVAGPLDSDYGRKMILLAESLLPGKVSCPPPQPRSTDSGRHSSRNGPFIHFPGQLGGEIKWAAMHGCEAFVLPSHQENFGIAVAEALSCGKPVLISDQVNIAPEIEAARAGLVGTDDQEGTHLLLGRWKDLQPVERNLLVRSAYACFRARFDVASAAERLLAALRTSPPNASRP